MGEPTRAAERLRTSGWPIAAVVLVVCIFLYNVREVIIPFVVAAAFGFLLSPLIERLNGLAGVPRWAAALLVYFAVLLGVGSVLYWVGPLIAADARQVLGLLPQTLHHFLSLVAPGGKLVLLGETIDAEDAASRLVGALRSHLLSPTGFAFALRGLGALLGLVLVLVLLAYFLFTGPSVRRGLLWLVPPSHRAEIDMLAIKVTPVLRQYFASLLVIVLYASSLSWLVFAGIFGLAHTPLLAIAVGLLELIPVVGPISSIVLVGLVALQQSTLVVAAGLAGFVLLLRLSIDQVVGPIVLGRATYLHPLVVIFAFLSGAVFLGVLGLIIAIPVAATIKIVLSHYYGADDASERERELAEP